MSFEFRPTHYDGILTDGRRCEILVCVEHTYAESVWGFGAGLWQHTFARAEDGEYVVDSTRIPSGEVRTMRAKPGDWTDGIPVHAATRVLVVR